MAQYFQKQLRQKFELDLMCKFTELKWPPALPLTLKFWSEVPEIAFNYKQHKSKNIVSSLWEKNRIKIDSEQKNNSY